MSSPLEKSTLEDIVLKYLLAKKSIIAKGYASEINWQDNINLCEISESTFLREAAWVVLSSGMKETVVQKVFPHISASFFDWKSAEILANSQDCIETALEFFGNKKKISAIVKIVEMVNDLGFESTIRKVQIKGVEFIRTFPFMGPATAFHFAKNIGVDVAKPDRHLVRIAYNLGYNCPHLLCADIAEWTEEKLSVIDLVLWRYAVTNKHYLRFFSPPIPRDSFAWHF